MAVSDDSIFASTAERAEKIIAACIEGGEAHLEHAIETLCKLYPDRADAIVEEVEAVQSAGLNRAPGEDADRDRVPVAGGTFEPIGPYQPLSELGRGGQGLVYLAEDTRLHRVVALKILKGFGPLSEKVMRRFKREAEVASKLDHPGICSVYDAGVKDGIPYIAMRFVAGHTLAESIRKARASLTPESSIGTLLELDEEPETGDRPEPSKPTLSSAATKKSDVLKIVAILEKAARALHVAHEAGIIHRDLKPGNIMVTPSGEPVLLDFGLASEEANELSLTQTGDVFGTPAYMSPEQLLAHDIRLDRRTDVFSLAVTLYECVTLQRPFEAPTREGLYQAIQYKHAPDARKLNREIPVDLKVVLEKALEKDRDRRYETALAFAEDLKRVRGLQPIEAKPVSAAGRFARWAKRRPFRAALVAALAIGVPAIAGLASYAIAKAPEIRKAAEAALLARVERHLEDGYDELAHGDPKVAMASFELALALQADCAEAIGGKALALFRGTDHTGCLAFLDAAAHVRGGAWGLDRIRIDALRRLGRNGEADDLARRSASEPRRAFDFFLAGQRLMRGCREQTDKQVFRTAFDLFMRATLTARHARRLYHLALAHAAGHLGEEGPGRQAAGALLALWPGSAVANRWAGFAFSKGKR